MRATGTVCQAIELHRALTAAPPITLAPGIALKPGFLRVAPFCAILIVTIERMAHSRRRLAVATDQHGQRLVQSFRGDGITDAFEAGPGAQRTTADDDIGGDRLEFVRDRAPGH